MNSNNTKSSAELHSDVRSELNNVNQGINRFQKRMTPGQLVDDAIFYPGGADPKATFEKLRLNPIGTSFLVMGTFLLMEDSYHQSYEAMTRMHGKETLEQLRAKTGSIKADAFGAFQSIKSSVADTKQKVVDQVDKLKEKTHITMSSQNTEDAVYDVGGVGMSSTGLKKSEMNINPMAIVALGLGLGSLTGAAIPLADQEHDLARKMGLPLEDFKLELKNALNQSVNVLKEEFLQGIQDKDFELF